jgi:serine/threonine-protein kinase
MRLGQENEAIELFERAATIMDRLPFFLGFAGWAYGVAGRANEARALLDELVTRAPHEYVPKTSIGYVLCGLGQFDEAFAYLDRAIDDREPMMSLTAYCPPFDPLRQDPRFEVLLAA